MSDNAHLIAIANRATVLGQRLGVKRNAIQYMMDLDAVHEKTPLDLKALAEADDGNFAHDVFGIMRHLDREAGVLTDFFVPRFTKRS